MAETKACRIEEDLDRTYFKIGRLIEGLRGRYREMALEVEGRIYVEGVSPEEALREIERIASMARGQEEEGRARNLSP